jgi:hypothetical protein
MLTELFEKLPETGDPDKPKLVFFFDEAHLLFTDLPKTIQDKVQQVVRLIRSKGVGIYFVTQNPIDIPDGVLGQLGNRVQHALRAFTPRDQKAVRAAAQTFRANPKINIETTITELGVGEALVSFLDEKGTPNIVERALVCPPRSKIGAITPAERQQIIASSLVAGVYEQAVDRESAYELLQARAAQPSAVAPVPATPTAAQPAAPEPAKPWCDIPGVTTRSGRSDSLVETVAKTAVRTVGVAVGRQIVRGLMGSLLGGSTTSKRRS